jgi:hypothetical protein
VNKGGGRCHTCGAVSQDIPEIWGDIVLPKEDIRCEGRGKGKGMVALLQLPSPHCHCSCCHVVIIRHVAESTWPRVCG